MSPEVQAERDRCAGHCERMAVIFDDAAARVRREGSFPVTVLTLKWPFFRKEIAVHHNWERVALQKDNAAHAMRMVKTSIVDGWELK